MTLQDLHWFTEELWGTEGYDQPERPWVHEPASPADSPYRRRPTAAATRGRAAQRACVVGGGLIGIEAVEVLVAKGIATTFLIREDAFWPIALDAAEAAWVSDALRAHGVDVRLGHEVTAVHGDADGCVQRVDTHQDLSLIHI